MGRELCEPPKSEPGGCRDMHTPEIALKCLCAQIRCGLHRSGAHSCCMCKQRTGSNCAIEVSRVDWDRYIYIYKHKKTTQHNYLPRFIAQQ